MANIEDSGTREAFESGAVRDIQHGVKGRCDLLPLGTLLELFKNKQGVADVLVDIDWFIHDGKSEYLYDAVHKFMRLVGWDAETTLLELAKHYEDGAVKYGERNWERGIPLHSYIDSGVRHLLKWSRGDKDEAHDRAFLWNMIGAIWTNEALPKMHDLPFAKCKAESHEPEGAAVPKTYEDVVKEKYPSNSTYPGYCPDDYLDIPDPCDKFVDCKECWEQEYKGEKFKK